MNANTVPSNYIPLLLGALSPCRDASGVHSPPGVFRSEQQDTITTGVKWHRSTRQAGGAEFPIRDVLQRAWPRDQPCGDNLDPLASATADYAIPR